MVALVVAALVVMAFVVARAGVAGTALATGPVGVVAVPEVGAGAVVEIGAVVAGGVAVGTLSPQAANRPASKVARALTIKKVLKREGE